MKHWRRSNPFYADIPWITADRSGLRPTAQEPRNLRFLVDMQTAIDIQDDTGDVAR